jgi:tRNA(Ile)-lysidine synthase
MSAADAIAFDFPAPVRDAPRVHVGLSGGLDSTVLLHLLAAARDPAGPPLHALHVHHGLHADADRWVAHCRVTCAALGVPLEVAHVDVPRDGGEGLEAAARRARYDAFASRLQPGEVLAVAHHQDDQAETFLLRALRASGDGLGAMRAWRPFAGGHLWRPLLDTPRAALLAHAKRHGLCWLDDPANASDAHDRNFLRRQVLPLLRARWPQASPALAACAALQREATETLDEGDALALARVRGVDPACVDVERLALLPAARRARVLRRWIEDCRLPPLPREGVARIERDLLGAAPDAVPAFAWRDAIVRRWRGLLWAGRARPALPATFRMRWDGRAALRLPDASQLAIDGLQPGAPAADWTVHARAGGERITLPGRAHSHALKHVLQDLGIPPWIRTRLPLVSDADGTVLAAGDLAVSARLAGWLRAGGLRLRWRPDAA